MAQYKGTTTAPHSPEEVWRYLADLRSVAEWDPSVERASLVAGEPGEVGSRYELEVSFFGRTVTLPYETVESDPPHRVVFRAETDLVSVRDEASIGLILDGGSSVSWDADLRLKGPQRVLDLPLRAAFAPHRRARGTGPRRAPLRADAVEAACGGPAVSPAGGRRRVAVVGAGVSGLVAAAELARAGHDVEVFEAGSHAGGHTNTVDVETEAGAGPSTPASSSSTSAITRTSSACSPSSASRRSHRT